MHIKKTHCQTTIFGVLYEKWFWIYFPYHFSLARPPLPSSHFPPSQPFDSSFLPFSFENLPFPLQWWIRTPSLSKSIKGLYSSFILLTYTSPFHILYSLHWRFVQYSPFLTVQSCSTSPSLVQSGSPSRFPSSELESFPLPLLRVGVLPASLV